MTDITMCSNSSCPSRSHCYRAQATPGEMQSWGEFEGRDFEYDCDHYIECKDKSQYKRLETQTK